MDLPVGCTHDVNALAALDAIQFGEQLVNHSVGPASAVVTRPGQSKLMLGFRFLSKNSKLKYDLPPKSGGVSSQSEKKRKKSSKSSIDRGSKIDRTDSWKRKPIVRRKKTLDNNNTQYSKNFEKISRKHT